MGAMDQKDIDALIASTKVNIQYLTDVPSITGFAVLPRENQHDPFLITSIANNCIVVDSCTWVKDIRFCGGAYYWSYNSGSKLTDLEKKMKANYDSAVMDMLVPDPWSARTPAMMEELAKGLQERGLDEGKLGIEERGTTITEFSKLRRILPRAELVLADDAFSYARQVKTIDELRLFEESVPIVEEGWKAVCETAREGVTEGELVKEYKRAVVSHGAGVLYNFHLAIGRRSIMRASGTGVNRSAKLKRGDLITFNGGIVFKNHPTHLARTAVLGEPENPKVNRYYKAILDAEDAGLEALRPGVRASEIYKVMMVTARKAIPNYNRHHTGHAVGLSEYDTPNFMANDIDH